MDSASHMLQGATQARGGQNIHGKAQTGRWHQPPMLCKDAPRLVSHKNLRGQKLNHRDGLGLAYAARSHPGSWWPEHSRKSSNREVASASHIMQGCTQTRESQESQRSKAKRERWTRPRICCKEPPKLVVARTFTEKLKQGGGISLTYAARRHKGSW